MWGGAGVPPIGAQGNRKKEKTREQEKKKEKEKKRRNRGAPSLSPLAALCPISFA